MRLDTSYKIQRLPLPPIRETTALPKLQHLNELFPLWAEAIHVSIPVRSADFGEEISDSEKDVLALFTQIAESSQPLSPRAQATILVCSAGVKDHINTIPVLELMWRRGLFQPIGRDFLWPLSEPDFLTTSQLCSFIERLCTT